MLQSACAKQRSKTLAKLLDAMHSMLQNGRNISAALSKSKQHFGRVRMRAALARMALLSAVYRFTRSQGALARSRLALTYYRRAFLQLHLYSRLLAMATRKHQSRSHQRALCAWRAWREVRLAMDTSRAMSNVWRLRRSHRIGLQAFEGHSVRRKQAVARRRTCIFALGQLFLHRAIGLWVQHHDWAVAGAAVHASAIRILCVRWWARLREGHARSMASARVLAHRRGRFMWVRFKARCMQSALRAAMDSKATVLFSCKVARARVLTAWQQRCSERVTRHFAARELVLWRLLRAFCAFARALKAVAEVNESTKNVQARCHLAVLFHCWVTWRSFHVALVRIRGLAGMSSIGLRRSYLRRWILAASRCSDLARMVSLHGDPALRIPMARWRRWLRAQACVSILRDAESQMVHDRRVIVAERLQRRAWERWQTFAASPSSARLSSLVHRRSQGLLLARALHVWLKALVELFAAFKLRNRAEQIRYAAVCSLAMKRWKPLLWFDGCRSTVEWCLRSYTHSMRRWQTFLACMHQRAVLARRVVWLLLERGFVAFLAHLAASNRIVSLRGLAHGVACRRALLEWAVEAQRVRAPREHFARLANVAFRFWRLRAIFQAFARLHGAHFRRHRPRASAAVTPQSARRAAPQPQLLESLEAAYLNSRSECHPWQPVAAREQPACKVGSWMTPRTFAPYQDLFTPAKASTTVLPLAAEVESALSRLNQRCIAADL